MFQSWVSLPTVTVIFPTGQCKLLSSLLLVWCLHHHVLPTFLLATHSGLRLSVDSSRREHPNCSSLAGPQLNMDPQGAPSSSPKVHRGSPSLVPVLFTYALMNTHTCTHSWGQPCTQEQCCGFGPIGCPSHTGPVHLLGTCQTQCGVLWMQTGK
jgi:hypothetical protein